MPPGWIEPTLWVNDSLTSYWTFPPTPRLATIPLPPVTPQYGDGGYFGAGGDNGDDPPGGGVDHHRFDQHRRDSSAQKGESPIRLAAAKPESIENKNQSEVSCFFTPLVIMLYLDGLGGSQGIPFRNIGGVTTVRRTTHRRNASSLGFAKRWGFPRKGTNSPPFREVRRPIGIEKMSDAFPEL